MLYNFQWKKLCRHLMFGGALCAAGLGTYSCSDKYDLDSEQPSGGVFSIYGYLQEQGNFNYCMRLIDDLGMTEVFSQTGSKTMFIADDNAFNAFFASNKWGVRSYDGLSLAQKKLLLNTAMIDNPLSTAMLSTATGPVRGEVCRRASSVTIYDSVLSVPRTDPKGILPKNDLFNKLKSNTDRENIVMFTDHSSAAPVIHFNGKFLTENKIPSTDIDFIYNQPAGTRKNDDVYVNNARVIEPNIFCKNGFIHKVDRVIVPLDNMAEVIRQKPQFSWFNSIIERFAVPDYSLDYTKAYNENKGTNVDSVFNKRFFSDRSEGSSPTSSVPFTTDPWGGALKLNAQLKFDPGWNAYLPFVANDRDGMMEDLAVMIVPTDEAMSNWWNNESGRAIKEFYGSLDGTPESTLQELVNVNQLVSFIQSCPSRFGDILDDANGRLGITEADIDSVFLACNGVIYMTNKVFAPKSYSSVYYPVVLDTIRFSSMNNAIKNLQYNAYLNSMVSKYVFTLPTNDGLKTYIDPVSYGRTDAKQGTGTYQLWEFRVNPSVTEAWKTMEADVYDCTWDGNEWVKDGSKVTTLKGGTGYWKSDGSFENGGTNYKVIRNRMENMLDNIILVEKYAPGKRYYRTKGNTFVRVDGNASGSDVYGSLQESMNAPMQVIDPYNMENGTTLVLPGVPASTNKSVATILSENSDFSDFFSIANGAGAFTKSNPNGGENLIAGDQSIGNLFNTKSGGAIGAEDTEPSKTKYNYLLNNYHYTLYVPTNDAMQEAFSAGLPTAAQLADAENYDALFDDWTSDEAKAYIEANGTCPGDSADRIREVWLDFVRYHIQDNSIYLDGDGESGSRTGTYESGKSALSRSTDVAEKYDRIPGTDKYVTVSGTTYEVKKLHDDFVEYYTGKYSPGRPFKIQVQSVSPTNLTVEDNLGNVRHVVTTGNLYNLTACEYWYNGSSNNKPYQTTLDNFSSVVIHAVDGPLLYADGQHRDSNGDIVETQFKYKYKPLTK